MEPSPIIDRLITDAKAGAVLGIVFRVIATLSYLIRGPGFLAEVGIGLPILYVAYLIGGSASGAIAMLLLPLGRTLVGAIVVGTLSILPLVFGARLVLKGLAPWDREDTVVMAVTALLVGGGGGAFAHHELKDTE